VMLAALSSGLGWMLYKWLRRRRSGQRAVSADNGVETVGVAPEAGPPAAGNV
jgi:hypothetical protein